MTRYFITGNINKFEEAKLLVPGIVQLDIDLREIQEIDSRKIIKAKILEASLHHKGEFIVEDTSLSLDCLNKLPGPFIKWFEKMIGIKGIADLAEKMGNTNAEAKATIGFLDDKNKMHFFEGSVLGDIVQPKVSGFGWDPIFQPKGYNKTFGQMSKEEKNHISHRRQAFDNFIDFIKSKSTQHQPDHCASLD